jgi:hypothetical protein
MLTSHYSGFEAEAEGNRNTFFEGASKRFPVFVKVKFGEEA